MFMTEELSNSPPRLKKSTPKSPRKKKDPSQSHFSRGNIPQMSSEWKTDSAENALKILEQSVVSVIDLTSFTFEKSQNRFAVKDYLLSKLKIFPWFHCTLTQTQRFRQTLKKNKSEGLTIEDVIEAINYFLRKNGSDYTEVEIQFLRSYYETMEIPAPSACLTPIVTLFHEFCRFQANSIQQVDQGVDTIDPQSSSTHDIDLKCTVQEHAAQLVDLKNRVGLLESMKGGQDLCETNMKLPRKKLCTREGGDRACWFRIRDVDYPSRMEWCTPGGVFGLYSDGVGPLLPNHVCPRRSVVVYSVNPDTVEAHPDPSHEDHYVRVVMVRFLVLSPLCDSSFLIVVFIFSHLFCVRSEKLL
jgi:hypothetical protein